MLDLIAHPSMGGYLINKPFGVVWIAHVIEGLGISRWQEPIVVGLMLFIFELLRQLEHILIIHLYAIRNDLHRSYVFLQELPSSAR